MGLVPSEAHHSHQKCLDQAVSPDSRQSLALPLRSQHHPLIRLVLYQPSILQAAHHARRSLQRCIDRIGPRRKGDVTGTVLLKTIELGEVVLLGSADHC